MAIGGPVPREECGMAELIQLKCPNCSGPVEWAGGVGAQCPHCGSRFLVPTEAAEQLACPVCDRVDRVQKASAACQADSRLSAPAEPSPSDATGSLALGLGVVVLVIIAGPLALISLAGALFALDGGEPGWALALVAAAVIVSSPAWVNILSGSRSRARAQERYAREKPKWEKAMNRWGRLYYCGRDDGIFIPEETPFIPIDKLQEFLYAE